MKTWTGMLEVKFTITEDEIKNDKWFNKFFIDPANPTDKEIRSYMRNRKHNYAEFNDVSELIANAPMIITCKEV